MDVTAVNPSSVQGPGCATGNGKIIIAYLNGRLRVFVDTHISVVDIRDTVYGHLLAAEHGHSGERYLLNGTTITSREALGIVSELSGIRDRVHMVPPALALGGGRRRGRGPRARPDVVDLPRTDPHHPARPSLRRLASDTRARVDVHPIAETFRRTIEWGG